MVMECLVQKHVPGNPGPAPALREDNHSQEYEAQNCNGDLHDCPFLRIQL